MIFEIHQNKHGYNHLDASAPTFTTWTRYAKQATIGGICCG